MTIHFVGCTSFQLCRCAFTSTQNCQTLRAPGGLAAARGSFGRFPGVSDRTLADLLGAQYVATFWVRSAAGGPGWRRHIQDSGRLSAEPRTNPQIRAIYTKDFTGPVKSGGNRGKFQNFDRVSAEPCQIFKILIKFAGSSNKFLEF